jgi:hypothetical protein
LIFALFVLRFTSSDYTFDILNKRINIIKRFCNSVAFNFVLLFTIISEMYFFNVKWSNGNRTQRLSMIKWKQNTKTINDQKERGTQRLSMIKRKQNTKTINDQMETEHKDYQWWNGNRTQRLSIIDSRCVLFPFDYW